jgi:hypothetical protein
VQALYNLTSSKTHFKGMERITKALLNLPVTNFDHAPFLIKALVNTSQYTWLRMRMIEDGALASIVAMLPTLSSRPNHTEVIGHILTCLRLLSDSPTCRNEMLSKGTVDILLQLLPLCDSENTYMLARTLFNLICGTPLVSSIFEAAVNVVTSIDIDSTTETLQYASACLNIFSSENMRGDAKLAAKVMDVIPAYLKSADSTIQLFALGTAANLFFGNLWYHLSR